MEDMTMKNILDELYDSGLFHLTKITDVGDEYRKKMEQLLKVETELLKAFPNCEELLNEFKSVEIDLIELSNRYEFIVGFKVGAQLVFEIIKPIKWGIALLYRN